MFKTRVQKLNANKPYIFFNRGLISGIIAKLETKTGLVKYYTSNYKVFTNYTQARITQSALNR